MKRVIYILIFSMIFVCGIYADSGQKIVDVDDNLYDYIDLLYSLENKNQPSTIRPWSLNEFNSVFERIDYNSLDSTEKRLYEKIQNRLNHISYVSQLDEKINLSFGLRANPQLYLHTNKTYDLDDKWINAKSEDRKALLNLNFDFSYKDYLFYHLVLDYGNSRYFPLLNQENENIYYELKKTIRDDSSSSNDYNAYIPIYDPYYAQIFATNVHNPYRDFRLMGPYNNYISVGTKGFNFSFSKDKLNIGQSIVGNMLVDKHVQYFDSTNLSIYSEKFKFSWVNMFFDTQKTHLQEDKFDGFKLMMLARFEYSITPQLSFFLTDGMMYHGNNFSFANLNPSYYFHSLNNREIFNSIASFDITYNISNGFKAYFQFVVDQLKLPNEKDSTEPSAVGLILGSSNILKLDKSLLNIQTEFGFTSPQLYKRDKVDFIIYNRYYTNGSLSNTEKLNFVFDFDYIGFPYGGDCLYGKVQTDFYSLDSFKAEASYLLLAKGYTDIFSKVIENSTETTFLPKKIKNIYNVVNFKFFYDIDSTLFSDIDLEFGLALVNRFDNSTNTNSFDTQFNIGYSIKI